MPPNIHLGVNTCFAVKRWPEPARWTAIVKEELGLDCCQFSLDLVDPLLDEAATAAYANGARERAAAQGLHVHSTFTGLAAYSWNHMLHPDQFMRDEAMRWYQRAIDFTARLGASGTGGHLGALSVQDSRDEVRRQFLVQELEGRLRSLVHYAAGKGLKFFLFENMAVDREWGHTLEEAKALTEISVEGGVPLVLCLDVGHPCVLNSGSASDDYLSWLAAPWPHAPVIHLQQTDRTGDHHWPFTAERNRVGAIDADLLLKALARWPAGEDLYLFLEPIHPFEANDSAVLQDLRESVRYWREAMQAQGLAGPAHTI